MDLAGIALGAGRANASTGRAAVDIITFIEAPWGLQLQLFPVQRVFLKTFYGIPLDNNPRGYPLDVPVPESHPFYDLDQLDIDGYYKYRVVVTNWQKQNPRYMTEEEYLVLLHREKRCNISKVIPGRECRELVLALGRRSGKTELSSCIAAYETYRLLSKGDPQAYYGIPPSENIQLISFATDKDQAGILYQKVSGYFLGCSFFTPYTANNTQSYARFQTPRDIERYGSYQADLNAKATIKVTFRSSVAKGSRGAGNIVVILDEIAHFTDNGRSSADAVYKAVAPSTATFSPKDPRDKRKSTGDVESKIISISSPLGKQGLFYKLFSDGFKSKNSDRLCFQAPTWEANPSVPVSLYESEYLKDVRDFDVEFGASFSDRTRGWIEDADDLLRCVDLEARPRMKAPPKMPHFMGVDIGLVDHYSVVAIGHLDDERRIIVDLVDAIRAGEGDFADHERLDFDDVADWVYDWSRRFYIVDGLFDQWLGIPLEQALQKRGLSQIHSEKFSPQMSSQMFKNFKDMMYDHRLVLYDWPVADGEQHCPYIQELLELQATYKSKYVTLVEKPNVSGKFDDHADALVRMVWTATQKMGKVIAMGSQDGPQRTGMVNRRVLLAARQRAILGGSHESRQIRSSTNMRTPKKKSVTEGGPAWKALIAKTMRGRHR